MNLIELHILQSFPVTCLNRDDVGAPKSAVFGGSQRARVSSQCWKRAIRDTVKNDENKYFAGQRGHFLAEQLETALVNNKIPAETATEISRKMIDFLGKTNKKIKEMHKSDVALFFSPGEIELIALAAVEEYKENGKVDPKKGQVAKMIKAALPHDLADIAIFGRMVATDHTLMVEGAGLFSHALSTHSVSNEIDFFSAVDETKHESDEGAGHIGTLEFNSACYYRYVGLNLDMLKDEAHLAHFSAEELAEVIKSFLKAAVLAVPEARKNSMFGHNPPEYILGLRRTGQPLSLVNAFEKPVRSKGGRGYVQESIEKLKAHHVKLNKLYNLATEGDVQVELPPENLEVMLLRLVPGE